MLLPADQPVEPVSSVPFHSLESFRIRPYPPPTTRNYWPSGQEPILAHTASTAFLPLFHQQPPIPEYRRRLLASLWPASLCLARSTRGAVPPICCCCSEGRAPGQSSRNRPTKGGPSACSFAPLLPLPGNRWTRVLWRLAPLRSTPRGRATPPPIAQPLVPKSRDRCRAAVVASRF